MGTFRTTILLLLTIAVSFVVLLSSTRFRGDGDEGLEVAGEGLIMKVVPSGTILAYGGTKPPPGFLMCDGKSYSRDTYSSLFAIVGGAFGASDGSHFNVPDLRGQFLRGVCSESDRDPDRDARLPMAAGGNAGNQVGSIQADTFLSHAHRVDPPLVTTSDAGQHSHEVRTPWNVEDTDRGIGNKSLWSIDDERQSRTSEDGIHHHSVDIPEFDSGLSGGLETRPKNAYVNFIIKH